MNKTIIDLKVNVPKHYTMSIDYFYNQLVSEYKKDYPECFNETDFYDYVDENLSELIRIIFNLEPEEEISEDELDYIFDMFEDYWSALPSK